MNHSISPFLSVMHFNSGLFVSFIVTVLEAGIGKPWQNLLCIQHHSSSSHSFQPEAKPPVQLVPAAAWTSPKSEQGAGFIHTSKHRDIRQIRTEKGHRGFGAGKPLKIGCNQDSGWQHKQMSSLICNLSESLKRENFIRLEEMSPALEERDPSVLSSSCRKKCPHCAHEL